MAIALLALASCGAADIPTQQLTSAKAAIRGAVEAGAKKVPKGALHLKMAPVREFACVLQLFLF